MSEPENVWKTKSSSTTVSQAASEQLEDFVVYDTEDPTVHVVQYITTNDQNQRIQVKRTVQRQVRIQRVRKSIEERRIWEKFGMGTEGKYYSGETGDEYKVSTTEETTQFVKSAKTSQNEVEKILDNVIKEYFEEGSAQNSGIYQVASADGSYVAPHERNMGGAGGRFGMGTEERKEEVTNLKLSNLSNEMGEDRSLLHGLIKYQWKKVIYANMFKGIKNNLKAFREECETAKKRFEKASEDWAKISSKNIDENKLLQIAENTKRVKTIWEDMQEKVKKFIVKLQVFQEFTPGKITRNAMLALLEKVEDIKDPKKQDAAKLRNHLRQLIFEDFEYILKDRPMRGIMRGISINYDHRDEGYYAYIRFHHRADAAAVMEQLKGQVIGNLIIRVEWAKPRRRRF